MLMCSAQHRKCAESEEAGGGEGEVDQESKEAEGSRE